MRDPIARISVLCLWLVSAVSCGGGGSSSSTPTAPSTTTPAPSANVWTSEGVRLTEVTAGVPGLGIADSTVFQTNAGTWRMFFNVQDGFLRSATSPDGLSWTVDANKPFAVRGSVARFVRFDSGHVRVFFACSSCPGGNTDDIHSAVSTDEGVTWTIENGVRIASASVGAARLTGMSVVRTSDNRWRGYFAPQGTLPTTPIYSATSTDQLNWTLDPGTRLGPGNALQGGAHPCAIFNSNGTTSLFYWRGAPDTFPVTVSTSTDGLTFTSETKITGLPGSINADPEVVRVGSGLRLYYNAGNDTSGTIYSALNATGLVSSSIR
jgi:hypothetical protein